MCIRDRLIPSMIMFFISSYLLYRVLRASVLAFAALDALFGVNLVRLAKLTGYCADRAQPCALCTADALERIYPHRAQAAACTGRALLINDMRNVLVLEIFECAEYGVRCGLAEACLLYTSRCV